MRSRSKTAKPLMGAILALVLVVALAGVALAAGGQRHGPGQAGSATGSTLQQGDQDRTATTQRLRTQTPVTDPSTTGIMRRAGQDADRESGTGSAQGDQQQLRDGSCGGTCDGTCTGDPAGQASQSRKGQGK